MNRRVLRRLQEEDDRYLQIPYGVPVVGGIIKEKTSPIGSALYIFGGFLMLASFLISLLNWIITKMPLLLPITIPAEFMMFVPWMFGIGIVLSIISMFIQPTAGKIVLTIFLALGYASIALGWLDLIFSWFTIF